MRAAEFEDRKAFRVGVDGLRLTAFVPEVSENAREWSVAATAILDPGPPARIMEGSEARGQQRFFRLRLDAP